MSQHHADTRKGHALQTQTVRLKHKSAQQTGEDGLAYVDGNDHRGAPRAVAADEVGQSRVAAAMAAHIVVKHGADADGAVVVAEKIGDKGGNENSLEHHSSSLSPRCRMVMRMGVPFRPKTSRIWFSR